MDVNYSVWLTGHHTPYSEIIVQCSQLLQQAPFEAHVTVLGNVSENISSTLEQIHSYIEALMPIPVINPRIHTGESFFKAAYIEFDETEQLTELNTLLSRTFQMNDAFNPHISLAYGHLSNDQKQRIVDSVKLPSEFIHFDAIELISASTWKNPATWQSIWSSVTNA